MGFSLARFLSVSNTSRRASGAFSYLNSKIIGLFGATTLVNAPTVFAQTETSLAGAGSSPFTPVVFVLSLILVILIILSISLLRQNRKTERELKAQLEEQRSFGQTILHRVSNNIQVLTALIRMEQRRNDASDSAVTERLLERIETMAAMHQLIDPEGIHTVVPARPSLHRALDSLVHRLPEGRQLDLSIDNVTLPIDKAFKLALLISEVGGSLCESTSSQPGSSSALNVQLTHIDDESLALAFENKLQTRANGVEINGLQLSPIRKKLTELLVRDLGGDPKTLATIDFNRQFGVRFTFKQPHEISV